MQILLIGAGGQLAEDLRELLVRDQVTAVAHADLDITDGSAVKFLVEKVRPACILNTAAFNLVDACEDRAEDAFGVNALGVHNLARAAQEIGAVLVHFSTNYVFDGAKHAPYVEADAPRPLSVYGMSKLAGEWFVQRYSERYFLVRTAALYGLAGNRSKGGNFVERMIRSAQEGKPVRVVDDQVVSPTWTRDLAAKLAPLIRTGRYGLYHMNNTGECSWYEFAREIFRQVGLDADLAPASSKAFAAKAVRPAYSVLENRALREAGFSDFRPWQEALREYLGERGYVR